MERIKKLKIIRFIVHLIVIIAFTSLFALVFDGFKSLLKFLGGHNIEYSLLSPPSIAFFSVVLISFFWGRFFCGWLCAFGAVTQQLFNIRKKFFKKRFTINLKVHYYLKYLKYFVLGVVIILVITNQKIEFITNINPWDAFDNILEFSENFYLKPISFIFLFLIIILSMFYERFFCKYLCPLGPLLGFFNKISFFSLRKDTNICGKCISCTKTCPMNIDLSKKSKIKSMECISCFTCTSVCKKNNIKATIFNKSINIYKTIIVATICVVFINSNYYNIKKAFTNNFYSIDKKEIEKDDIKIDMKNDSNQFDEKVFESEIDSKINESKLEKEVIVKTPIKMFKDGIFKGNYASLFVEVEIINDKINDIRIIKHKQDRGYFEEPFSIIPKKIIEKQSIDVDVISGATNTSSKLLKAVENAIEKAKIVAKESENLNGK